MSKKNVYCKYLEAPSFEAIDECCTNIDMLRRVLRKPKKSKIESIIPTVTRCLQLKKSSRQIVSIVNQLHGISISKDTVLRFSRNLANPLRK